MRHSRTTTLALAATLATGMLAGCSSDDSSDDSSAPVVSEEPTSSASTETPGTDDASAGSLPDGVTVSLPDGVEAPSGASGGAGLGDDGTTLWVVTYGSSTNPTVATVESAESGTVTVSLAAVDPDAPATADYVPTTTVLDLPDELDTTAPFEVVLGELGSVEVDGAEPPGWLVG